MPDFFISYNKADRQWAEWIAWQLEEAGYTTVIQAWDFGAGGNFVLDMQKAAAEADRTIAVLSPDYLASRFTAPEWAAAFAQDPTGEKRQLVPVRVRECDLVGLSPQIVYIDLVDLDEPGAKTKLLDDIKLGRKKPAGGIQFPGAAVQPVPTAERAVKQPPRFPGSLPQINNITHRRNPQFTGRARLLEQLRRALTDEKRAAVTQAIHGQGASARRNWRSSTCTGTRGTTK